MKTVFYILLIILFCSCNCNSNSKSNNSPKLNSSEITDILTELHLTEAYVSQLKLNTSNTLDSLSYYKQLVFKKHQITEKSFDQSMEYYTHHPIKLQEIYKKVKKQIQVLDLQLPHIKDTAQPIQKEINDTTIKPSIKIKPFSKDKTQ